MKMSEAIARADALRPNTADEAQKAEWLWELEGQLREMMELPLRPSRWPEVDEQLLLEPLHQELYQLYLVCKLDYYNQEMELYSNDRILYNAALTEAQARWRRRHRPKSRGGWRV